ncbi:hypothetical protein LCGC14_1989330 [marine sediment metagenome]|nr:FAD:protein FMN transferase [Pseudoalteromonas prydzensis]HEA16623.1 FAD:protein FMN transferase [Pseudoalteromonas prydzensis]
MKTTLMLLAIAVCLLGCQPTEQVQSFSGAAQGTTYHVRYWSEQPISQPAFQRAVEQELQRIDSLMSNYRNDSVIEKFNQQHTTDAINVGPEIVQLVTIAKQISEATSGCYDLTIAPLFSLWGFRDQQLTIPSEQQRAQLAPQIGLNLVNIVATEQLAKSHPAVSIDLSSIAQGYSVQRLVDIAKQYGISNYLIEIGGELQTQGSKPDGRHWRIAIDKPLPQQQQLQKIVDVIKPEPLAIMTSGTYRHYYDQAGNRYSHIIDARRLAPVSHSTVSVTVFHDDLSEADAWSTALLCLGSAAGMDVAKQYGLSVLFIDQHQDTFTEYSSTALQHNRAITLTQPQYP